jgi:hypothetical protein
MEKIRHVRNCHSSRSSQCRSRRRPTPRNNLERDYSEGSWPECRAYQRWIVPLWTSQLDARSTQRSPVPSRPQSAYSIPCPALKSSSFGMLWWVISRSFRLHNSNLGSGVPFLRPYLWTSSDAQSSSHSLRPFLCCYLSLILSRSFPLSSPPVDIRTIVKCHQMTQLRYFMEKRYFMHSRKGGMSPIR